eukprot:scaffold220366_cov35-Tisochrysis_lutea.AAC.3
MDGANASREQGCCLQRRHGLEKPWESPGFKRGLNVGHHVQHLLRGVIQCIGKAFDGHHHSKERPYGRCEVHDANNNHKHHGEGHQGWTKANL